jgi:hypothetical protein
MVSMFDNHPFGDPGLASPPSPYDQDPCLTCDRDAAWHRRQIEHLESTVGPRAVYEFEAAHPEPGADE